MLFMDYIQFDMIMAETIHDKDGKPIQEGDEVFTPIRGGKHQGEVEKIVTTEEEAKAENVKNPPKVFFRLFFYMKRAHVQPGFFLCDEYG